MIGDRHDLAQLVGDQHHSHALPAQRIEDAEELIRLLRCQHPRRLVENENVGATVERLQNLDALLLARSEEHTSELQSLMRISYAVFCLKKKINNTKKTNE